MHAGWGSQSLSRFPAHHARTSVHAHQLMQTWPGSSNRPTPCPPVGSFLTVPCPRPPYGATIPCPPLRTGIHVCSCFFPVERLPSASAGLAHTQLGSLSEGEACSFRVPMVHSPQVAIRLGRVATGLGTCGHSTRGTASVSTAWHYAAHWWCAGRLARRHEQPVAAC
jgi:hypothetical protein